MKINIVWVLLGVFFQLNAEISQPKICLNMIVKDETPVIRRCLESTKPLIDYWVIVDTGSRDGTQEMIKEFMKDIPGELHERPWLNFAHNRNEALELAKAKGDYVLIMDADEELLYDKNFKKPVLDKDFYYIKTSFGGTNYSRVQLINNHLDWKWIGVLHEALNSSRAKSSETLLGVVNLPRTDGNRSQDPEKFQKDSKILETALETEPNNTRYMFYLAQSYRDAGNKKQALETYKKRVAMQGWDQEVFWSLLQIALLKEALDYSSDEVVKGYQEAFAYRPQRLEPLYYLALYHRKRNNYVESFKVSRHGLALKESTDLLFVEKWIYDYGLLLEYSIAAYWTGHYQEALIASQLLLSKPSLPENYKQAAENNLKWINQKLADIVKGQASQFLFQAKQEL